MTKKNILFLIATLLSIVTIPVWFIGYSPLTRLLRIPYALISIGYAKGIKEP